VTDSRAVLGTYVTIEAYGEDKAAVRVAVDDAFEAIARVDTELDAYSETSTLAAFNATPFEWQTLPQDAVEILDSVDRLGVSGEFSPVLLGVVGLYDFGGAGHVPTDGELSSALLAASMPERDGDQMRFGGIASSYSLPGLDFGGAAKGLALDRAREALRASGSVTAAIVGAGSTTLTLGTKPGGDPWRVGIEDPRTTEVIRAVSEWTGDAALSTSGDYQQYFERGGVRYHHILDPRTGEPVRGTRSLSTVGRFSGLDSDILSTALFVSGPDAALAYAAENGLGCYVVDGEGRTRLAPAPAETGISLVEQIDE
jgi:thiamine biosynthesis lipoprotein